MKYYLLDTCSYIAGLKFTGNSCLKHDFLELSKTKQCGIYIPQSCVPEVINEFARACFVENNKSKEEYDSMCKTFYDHISNRATIYVYDLHRYHNIQAGKKEIHKIAAQMQKKDIEIRKTQPKHKIRFLSGPDVIIIAMALELREEVYKNDSDEIIILTEDLRLKQVAEKFPNLKAESVFRDVNYLKKFQH